MIVWLRPLFVLMALLYCSSVGFCAVQGDVDGNGVVGLPDVILSLQVCAGTADIQDIDGDVDGNQRIGLAEAIFALRKVSSDSGDAEYSLGDAGKPSDYDDTALDLSQFIGDYDMIVDQLPTSFDWRDQGVVTPARNQGSCGSCWAFASVGVMESRILMSRRPGLDLSEQQQVSCNNDMWGCDGGSSNALKFWRTVGPFEESCAGYEARLVPCGNFESCQQLPYYSVDHYNIEIDSINNMKVSLRNDGPAYFRFEVYVDFYDYWKDGSAGSVYHNASSTRRGGHAVLLIGWDDDRNAWLCMNSWGQNAGPNGDGTFWMAYGGHAQPMNFGMAGIRLAREFGLTTPNGGEQWEKGSLQSILWEKGNAGNLAVNLFKAGSMFASITENVVNNGIFSWTVPKSLSTGGDYQVQIVDVNNADLSDVSDAYFSIVDPLTIVSPNGGETWQIGETYNVRWQTGANSGDVKIYLYESGDKVVRELAGRETNDGQWAWTVPDNLWEGSDYSIYMRSWSDETIFDQSDAAFSIVSSPTCVYEISPANKSFAAAGGSGSVSVSTQEGCGWTASSNVNWIGITSGSDGIGNGTIEYSVSANSGMDDRSGTLSIAGEIFTVTQSGATGGTLVWDSGNWDESNWN